MSLPMRTSTTPAGRVGPEAPCYDSARPGQHFAAEILFTEYLIQTLSAQQPVKCIMCDLGPALATASSQRAVLMPAVCCRGTSVEPVLPLNCGSPSALAPQPRDWDILLTAETHNFPCAVAPYPGAAPQHTPSAQPLASWHTATAIILRCGQKEGTSSKGGCALCLSY